MALLSSAAGYGQPSADNYVLGRGSIFLDVYDASLNVPLFNYRNLGNSTDFALNIEEEELEHQSSRSGLRITDSSVSLSKELSGSFTLDEISEENLAVFLSGNIDESQTQSVYGSGSTGNYKAQYNNGGTLAKARGSDLAGKWFEIWNSGLTERVTNVNSITAVHPTSTASPEAVLGTDYLEDLDLGLIFIIPGGILDVADTVDFEFRSVKVPTNKDVIIFDRSLIRAGLVFKSINAQTGEFREVHLHKVKITAEGDLSLIGEEWANMQFNFTAETDATNHPSNPTGYIRGYSNAG